MGLLCWLLVYFSGPEIYLTIHAYTEDLFAHLDGGPREGLERMLDKLG